MFDQPILSRLPQSSFNLSQSWRVFAALLHKFEFPPMAEVFLVCVQLREITWHDVPIVYAANFRLFLREIEVGESNPTKSCWAPAWLMFFSPTLAEKTGIIQTPVFENMS